MKRISVLDFIEKIQAVPDIDVKIEKGIKTGEVSDKYAMEYLLGEIF